MVSIYGCKSSTYTEEDLTWIENRISPKRREIFARRKNPTDKLRCALAEMLLWHGLSDLGVAPGEFMVSYETEKPRLLCADDPQTESPLSFSYSHSGDWVICGISDAPIGVDVQQKTKRGALISSHVFSEGELMRLDQKDEEAFLRFWTCKESFIKCAYPVQENLRSVELDFSQSPYPITNRPDEEEFYFETFGLDETHTLSYCVRTREPFQLHLVL